MRYYGDSIITPRQVGSSVTIIATAEVTTIAKTISRKYQAEAVVVTYLLTGKGSTEYTEAELS